MRKLSVLGFTFLFWMLSYDAFSHSLVSEKDSVQAENSEKIFQIHFRPSLGLTFGDSNSSGSKVTSLQWLGTLNSDLNYIGKKFDFSSTLFMQYGENKLEGQESQKVQDAFILSLTPSIPVIKIPKIRLFLETTAETNLGKGTINDNPTGFADPLFLYQTLFIGQKHYSYQKEDKTTWDITYGVGYAFQQTLNKEFQPLSQAGNNPSFESGFSGILEVSLNSKLSESVDFMLNAKMVALSRENFFKDFNSSRRTVLIRSGIYYKKVGFEYNFHLVHDINLSEDDLVDKSLMLTLTF
ncbi:MAG TPA: DUF3078 domain-containing protein [Prolixibacteraceae bacterium]|nr:DUF3078 domain-containing protein [Prolixibacteraceae bacterium]HPR85201.1 DUF3078 domain-containing protein [Prolixibacteraceae bacterium]